MRKTLFVLLAGVLAAPLAGQQPRAGGQSSQSTIPQPTFRSDVNAVLLDLEVVDRQGNFVRELTKDDFQIEENGTPQTIATFELVDLPKTITPPPRFADRWIDSDVASNEHSEGRAYMLVLDDISVHPLRSVTVRALAREFVEKHVGPEDRVAMTTTSARKDMTLEFTDDKARLLATIDKFQAGYGITNDKLAPLHELRALADWLSFEGRRKAIVLISQGLPSGLPNLPGVSQTDDLLDDANFWSAPSDLPSVFESENDLAKAGALDLRDVIEAAARNNVAVYTIDPTGKPGAPAPDVKPLPHLLSLGPDIPGDSPYIRTTAQDTLASLARETGGFSLDHSNNFNSAFSHVVEAVSSYYLLGYVPTNTARDGKFRRIKVHAANPELRVRTRTGYLAETDKPSKRTVVPDGWTRSLVNVIQSPVQVSGLPMRVNSAAFRGKDGTDDVEIVIETTREALHFTGGDDRSNGLVNVAAVVADMDGHIQASDHGELEMHLSEETSEAVGRHGIRILNRLHLKPGHYALRVGGADQVGSTQGSVHLTLDVPDFSKGPLTMSGLLVSCLTEGQHPTTGSDKSWEDRFPGSPTTTRTFSKDDELLIFTEIYGNEKKAGQVDVTSSLRSESGEIRFRSQEVLPGGSAFGVHRYQKTISLTNLDPGQYLVDVEARSTSNVKASASREILLTVR